MLIIFWTPYTFTNIKIELLNFPASLKFVANFAFSWCEKLQSIEFLGDDLTLENNAFYQCENLHIISFPNAHVINIYNSSFNISNDFILFAHPNAKLVISVEEIDEKILAVFFLDSDSTMY